MIAAPFCHIDKTAIEFGQLAPDARSFFLPICVLFANGAAKFPGFVVNFLKPFDFVFQGSPLTADFVVAPNGPLSLQDARVWTHQVTLLIPITE